MEVSQFNATREVSKREVTSTVGLREQSFLIALCRPASDPGTANDLQIGPQPRMIIHNPY